MKSFITVIKSDYLQRTRSYAFLVTLCASLAIAYTFVPEPNANYSTIRIADYVGYYNSAWFGYVTAIMTSIFLSLAGFYLVNNSIKTDIDTKVGQIVATTKINNFNYLFSKAISNFLVLLTILLAVFTMSNLLFFLYNGGFPFEPYQFIKPYFLITIPSLFLISALAVVFEVILGRYSIVQNIGFFFVFSSLLVFSPKTEAEYSFDLLGSKIVMHQLEKSVRDITNSDEITDLSIGYVVPDDMKETKQFEFNGIDFPISFIISRFLWVVLGILLIFFISRFFHRFDIKERISVKKITNFNTKPAIAKDIDVQSLPKPRINYSIFPLLKTEFLLLFRKGKKWLWIINIIGVILLSVLPLKIAHQMVLPILWFLQVHRLSDITTKETFNGVHYFAFSSYKPMTRLLLSQVFSGVMLILILAIPIVIRFGVLSNFTAVLSILLGGTFIVFLAATLGLLSKGKKIFEVLFFMITYANINGILFLDYFGGFEHSNFYIIQLAFLSLILGVLCFILRLSQLKKM